MNKPSFLAPLRPTLVLAPMQDITDLPFWRLLTAYGGADLYFTEYFRVYETSQPDKHILKSILQNPTGRPVVAQIIGDNIAALTRTARELQNYPIVAVDLNLGCPAPVVYRKMAGGGLLRFPHKIDAILGALREAIHLNFTVKTRLGFAAPEEFEQLLPVFAKHSLDMLTVHGRTVKDGYKGAARYDYISLAARTLACPVLANGDIVSPVKAQAVLRETGACGIMIGRAALSNPWCFSQIRAHLDNRNFQLPTGRQVWDYLRELFLAVKPPGIRPKAHIEKMKKYFSYIMPAIDPAGAFLYEVQRATSEIELELIFRQYLDHDRPVRLWSE